MSSYNIVKIKCPMCKCVNRFQSKAGSCRLQLYSIETAPLFELADMQERAELGQLVCGSCEINLLVKVQKMVMVTTPEDSEFEYFCSCGESWSSSKGPEDKCPECEKMVSFRSFG